MNRQNTNHVIEPGASSVGASNHVEEGEIESEGNSETSFNSSLRADWNERNLQRSETQRLFPRPNDKQQSTMKWVEEASAVNSQRSRSYGASVSSFDGSPSRIETESTLDAYQRSQTAGTSGFKHGTSHISEAEWRRRNQHRYNQTQSELDASSEGSSESNGQRGRSWKRNTGVRIDKSTTERQTAERGHDSVQPSPWHERETEQNQAGVQRRRNQGPRETRDNRTQEQRHYQQEATIVNRDVNLSRMDEYSRPAQTTAFSNDEWFQPGNPRQSRRVDYSRIPGRRSPKPSINDYTPVAHSTANRIRDTGRNSNNRREISDNFQGYNAQHFQPRAMKIDSFPKDVPPSSKLHKWNFWVKTLNISMEKFGIVGQRSKAVELRLSAGDEVGQIIMTEDLMPEPNEVQEGFRFYDYLVDGVTRYFRGMTDANVNANEFHNMRQKEDESVHAYATRFKMAAMKCGLVTDSIATAGFLRGLRDEEAADWASGLNYTLEDTIPLVMRREAKKASQLQVAAVSHQSHGGRELKQERRRDREPQRSSKRDRSKEHKSKDDRERSGDSHKRVKRDESCWRCGRPHRGNGCPAINRECHICKEKGHFMAMCKKKKKDSEKPTVSKSKVKKQESSSSE
jgi:Retrotransposon gag protein